MTRVLIVGGGIAGAVTAMALAKAGLDPVVYEAYETTPEHLGTYLTVAVNGLSALGAVDALDVVNGVGFPAPTIAFYLGDGRMLSEIQVGGLLADGTTTRSVRRGDLHTRLLDEVRRRGIPVHQGKRLKSLTEKAGGVTAFFSDGSSAVGDLMVGCDGVHSTVRRLLFPDSAAARYTGLINIGGFTPQAGLDLAPGEHRMMFGRRAFFGCAVDPVGDVWWFANIGRKKAVDKSDLERVSDAQWRGRLAEVFSRDRGPARAVVQGSASVTVSNSYEVDDLPVWHSARVILVGDAAHAASPAAGQGASMAMEDAVVVAKCLRDLPSAEDAFKEFQRLRQPRARKVTVQGARASRFKAVGPVRRRVRDRKLPALLSGHAAGGEHSLAWIYEHRVDWDTPVKV
jgi:2-polyprenyl-6-methoxyphenol hydroxylase-like FAD-dependent oxidoreductase